MQRFLLAFLVFITGLQVLANVYDWYYTTRIDIPMHMMGGAFVALLFFYIFAERWSVLPLGRYRFACWIFSLGFVALMGIGWEIHEFLIEVFLVKRQSFGGALPGSLFDSLKDLVDDLIGGAVAAGIYLAKKRG